MSSAITMHRRPYVHVPHTPLWWWIFGIPALFLLLLAVWIACGFKMPGDEDEDDEELASF